VNLPKLSLVASNNLISHILENIQHIINLFIQLLCILLVQLNWEQDYLIAIKISFAQFGIGKECADGNYSRK